MCGTHGSIQQMAIKVRPLKFSLDLQSLARCEREAKMLSLLNRPNIAAIHGFDKVTDLV